MSHSTALARLGEVSRGYEAAAVDFRRVCQEAALAKAAYTKAKAKFKLRAKAAADHKMSDAEAETMAEADDEIADLYLRYLTTAALEKSHDAALRQMREQQANGRTAVVEEREIDRMHARGDTGAA